MHSGDISHNIVIGLTLLFYLPVCWNGRCSAEILSVGVGLMDLWVAAIHILLLSQLRDYNRHPIYKENFQNAQSQL